MASEVSEVKDYTLKDSGARTEFMDGTGGTREIIIGKGRFDLLPPATMRALAIHYEKGSLKYAARNWEKGVPISSFMNSGTRHLFQFMDGQNDENHLIAAIWNLVCAYETILRIQKGILPSQLNDMPTIVELPK